METSKMYCSANEVQGQTIHSFRRAKRFMVTAFLWWKLPWPNGLLRTLVDGSKRSVILSHHHSFFTLALNVDFYFLHLLTIFCYRTTRLVIFQRPTSAATEENQWVPEWLVAYCMLRTYDHKLRQKRHYVLCDLPYALVRAGTGSKILGYGFRLSGSYFSYQLHKK